MTEKNIKIKCQGAGTLPLESLTQFQGNLKTITPANLKKLRSRIIDSGFVAPIFIWQHEGKNYILDGTQRLLALKSLQGEGYHIPELPVAYVEADNEEDARKKLLSITSTYGDFNLEELQGWLTKVDEDIADSLRFFDKELNFGLDGKKETVKDDNIPGEVEPISKPGDLWGLGEHRVLCGDSTDKETIDKLMDGEKADMVFTDPPYNIDFKGTLSCTSKNGKIITMKEGYKVPNSQHNDIGNDNKDISEFNQFICLVLDNIKKYCVGGWYICFASKTLNELLTPLIEKKMKWKSLIIWNKNQSPMGGGHFRKKYEPIAYGYFNNFFYGKEYSEDDVWDIDRTLKNDLHPTMKPIALITKAVGYSSNSGGIVLDLFLGSGSTLIAAEKTNRKCYGMEIDPHYTDVTVNRYITWCEANGKIPEVKLNGETWEAVKNGQT